MAYLNLPAKMEEVKRADFIRWADRYVRFPCQEQLTGADLYGARCAMLHQHGVISSLHHEGKCRRVGYMDKSVPEVRFDPNVSSKDVLVSAPALAEAFFRGIDAFVVDLFSNPKMKELAEKRLGSVVICHRLRSTDSEARTTE